MLLPRRRRPIMAARWLVRLLAVTAGLALTVTAVTVTLTAITVRLTHDAASASEVPLPPLTAPFETGSTVYAADGHTVLATLQGPQRRIPISLSQVSPVLIKAVLDTEDHAYYLHGGFDARGVLRAAVHDASGGSLQGGSTIAQQLAKQLYLTPAQTVSRKIKQVALAERLVGQYSKNQILQAYLNTIYFGHGAYGVEAAAETYFQAPAAHLDLAQAALLAGLIQDPGGYDPVFHAVAARQRRTEVLQRMVVYHDITAGEAAAAEAVPLPTPTPMTPPSSSDPVTNYYVQEVTRELLGPGSPLGKTYSQRDQALFDGGLKIYTNLDPVAQADAEQAVASAGPSGQSTFSEAMVSINPATGAVSALVGGPGTTQSQFDVVTQGRRQPGSGFKLFTLLTALEQGYSVADTVDSRSPCAIKFPGNDALVTKPINNDTGPGGGPITITQATADSVNCAYIRLAHEVGLPNIITTAQQLGVSEITQADQYPSMVIGSIAVKPIEMAAAYAAVADNGVYHRPTFIKRIVDRSGTVIDNGASPGRRVFSVQVAAEADQALQAVVQYGTGTAAGIPGRQVAGKTGTTDHNVDAWFNGFTPQIETTVWMGDIKSETPIYINGSAVYGANYPAQTWQAFDAAVLANQPSVALPTPDPALVVPPTYVTSPSLVADDVLDHNGVP